MLENLAFTDFVPTKENYDKRPVISDSLLWNLLESFPQNISIWESGKLLYANTAFYKAVGVAPGNFEALNEFVLSDQYFSVHPDDFDYSPESMALLKEDAARGIVFHREMRMKSRLDTEYKWYSTYILKSKDPGSKVSIEIDENINDKKIASEKLHSALKDKEILLREIHHRVKNNFQVISSLLKLQSRKMPNPEMRTILEESDSRVMSMAMIHEMLYKSEDISHVDFGKNIKELVIKLAELYKGKARQVRFNIEINDVYLVMDKAIPCSLIVNELVSNSLKYAFNDESNPEILINIEWDGAGYILTVKDNGTGFPEGFDYTNTDTLGLLIVNTLASQMQAVITAGNNNGAEYKIKFKE